MANRQPGPRKPATKFPHLRKKMEKNAIPQQIVPKKFGPPGKKQRGAKTTSK
jgi:hypothetical protein